MSFPIQYNTKEQEDNSEDQMFGIASPQNIMHQTNVFPQGLLVNKVTALRNNNTAVVILINWDRCKI